MPKIQSEITCRNKHKKNLDLNEKRQSADDNTKIAQMLELSRKDFQVAIIKKML